MPMDSARRGATPVNARKTGIARNAEKRGRGFIRIQKNIESAICQGFHF
jgi:hypothetical protein